MSSWHSYPKIYNLGHAAVRDIFEGQFVVQEKIDGSQFSFGIFDGELKIRSKGIQMVLDAPEKMFSKAVEAVIARKALLRDGWTYRSEYLQKPKHNTLAYNRIPNDHLILFDINPSEESYLLPKEMCEEASRIGLEAVPTFGAFFNATISLEDFNGYLSMTSLLGGQKIEGVVVKNYAKFGPDKKVLMAKHVSEAFKEIHKADWKERAPGIQDVIEILVQSYRTPARWNKAVIHLKEKGLLTESPKDIGALIKECQKDLEDECAAEIKELLWEYVKPKLLRSCTGGLAQWYKDELLKLQFPDPK